VPLVAGHRPHALEIDVVAPTRKSARLRVNANGIELWQGSVPPSGWSATLALDRVPLTDELRIVLESDTFTPAVRSGSSDDARRLGVMVRAIRLQSRSRS
jgi:hypothetical protein